MRRHFALGLAASFAAAALFTLSCTEELISPDPTQDPTPDPTEIQPAAEHTFSAYIDTAPATKVTVTAAGGTAPTGIGAEPARFGTKAARIGAAPTGIGAEPARFGTKAARIGAAPTGIGTEPTRFGAETGGIGTAPSGSGEEMGTRVTVDKDEECYKVHWQANDEVFIKRRRGSFAKFNVVPDPNDATRATLVLADGEEWIGELEDDNDYYAAYYVAKKAWYESGREYIYTSVPYIQTYAPTGTVSPFPMEARSTSKSLSFKNLFGILQLRISTPLTGVKIKSIELYSEEEYLSGRYDSRESGDNIWGVMYPEYNDEDHFVTLDCGANGVAIGSAATDFNIILADDYYYGLRITILTTDGRARVLTTKEGQRISVEQNKVTPINFNLNEFFAREDYLCFTAVDNNFQVTLKTKNDPILNDLEFSTDKAVWADVKEDAAFPASPLAAGGKVYVRAKNARTMSPQDPEDRQSNYMYFSTSGKAKVSGDLMCLIDPAKTPEKLFGYDFYGLFKGSKITDASGLVFPSVAENYSFAEMFMECTELTALPVLPAEYLRIGSYLRMFKGCTALTSLPEFQPEGQETGLLPASSIPSFCYSEMFSDCTGLTSVPATLLPEKSFIGDYAYSMMFKGCSSLTSLPQGFLPATFLYPAEGVYANMFENCTSLTTVPTDLLTAYYFSEKAYKGMFKGCTSLTVAPVLWVAKVPKNAYQEMFYGCTSLKTVKCLAKELSDDCTKDWLSGASATGSIVYRKGTAWESGSSGIPAGWTAAAAIASEEYLEKATIFSISDTRKIIFSAGNLQATYDGTKYTWGLASSQYETVGNAAGNTTIDSQTSGNKVDLFCWTGASSSLTGDAMHGITTHVLAGNDDGYYGLGYSESLKSDWGKTLGGDDSPWFTLSKADWTYLLGRNEGKCFLKATVQGKAGIILYPDQNYIPYSEKIGYEAITRDSGSSSISFDTYTLDDDEWAVWEGNGFVFLPATGYRGGNSVGSVNSLIEYYCSDGTANDNNRAYCLLYNGFSVTVGNVQRDEGAAVRLVTLY